MENEFMESKKKNDKKGLIILIIILSLLLMATIGYIAYNELEENKEANKIVEEKIQNISDTTELKTSKKINELMDKYNLGGIIFIYDKAGAFNYNDFSKQIIDNNTKSYMLKVMVTMLSDGEETFLYNDFEGTGNVIKLNEDETEFANSIVATSWMYISDFNDYAKNVFKSNISLKENDSSNDFEGCPRMSIYKDKMYLSYQCGYEGGLPNPIYTSYVKEDNKIELYSVVYKEDDSDYIRIRVKYTFEYNGKIWTLKEVEPIETVE